MRLENKIAVVTGAGRGIGRGVALAFAAEGADVAVNYHSNSATADEVVAQIRSQGRQAVAVKADVGQYADAQKLIDTAVAELGGVDILVNNAGVSMPSMFLDMPEDSWNRVIDTHLKGTFNCTQVAGRHMKTKKNGKIINVISTAGLYGTVGQINYASAKAGMIGFTKSAARELGRYAINVNALCPGVTLTDMTESIRSNEKLRNMLTARIALGRFSEPEEIAPAFVFLASHESDYVTGHILEVNGGYIG